MTTTTSGMSEIVVVISDLQCPFHDPRAVDVVARFIKAYKPDSVLCVGDELDAPQISRWHKGMHGEFARDLGKDRDTTRRVLEQLSITHISRSNHTDRLENYLAKYAPGLSDLPELQIEQFLGLAELGITYHHRPYEFMPGWLLMHGDEGGLSQEPGKTAINLAKKLGKSVASGHTHRCGIQPHTQSSVAGITSQLYGFEVGHMMSLKHASYMAGGINWQQAFGVLLRDGKRVTPVPVFIQRDGSFMFDRKVWR